MPLPRLRVEASELLVETSLELGVERGAPVRPGARGGRFLVGARAQPAPCEEAERDGRDGEAGERKHPREEVEPAPGRRSEDALAELGHELALDLRLGVAGGDPRADVALHLLRDRRVGHGEGRLAGRAHDLALQVRERRPLGREGRRGERKPGGAEDEHEPAHVPPSARSMYASSSRSLNWPMTCATSRPRRSTQYVSGNPVRPKRPTDEPGPSWTIGYVIP